MGLKVKRRLETQEATTPAPTPAPTSTMVNWTSPIIPMDGRWHCHSDTNAFAGFGSRYDIDDDAASLKGVSMSTCQQHCRENFECGCVVHYRCPSWGCEHGLVDGQCWRRPYCDFSSAKHDDLGFQMCNINLGRL